MNKINNDTNGGSDMETLIYTEVCSDGSLAKWVRYPSGLVVIEFDNGGK